ncbi:hypothetical protein DdX_17712 [Ditylenchus destructor]|uniref:Uncharacterized protein n=1 Tax=Ditylenchus destructor TaxID=166010 RepID=A0AAD4QYR4_9BILA|nr:hypothetical protein DdX_17712 [Ditylenchus destructor]
MNFCTHNLDEFSYNLGTSKLPEVIYVHIYRHSFDRGESFMNATDTTRLQKQLIKTVPTKKKKNVVLDVASLNLDIYVDIKLLNQANILVAKEQYTPFKFQVMTVDVNGYVQEVSSDWEEGKNLGWTVKIKRGYYNPTMLHVSHGGQPLIEQGITDDRLAVPQFREGQSEYVDYFLLVQLASASVANPLKLTDAQKQTLKEDSLQKGMSTFATIREKDFKNLFKGIKQQIRSRKGQ